MGSPAAGNFFSTLTYLIALVLLPVLMPSLPLATEIVIMTIAALSCYLVLAYGPLLSFGQGAFFGIGAYAGAWYAIRTAGTPMGDAVPAIVLCAAVTSAIALVVGAVTLKRVVTAGGQGTGSIAFLMLTFAIAQVAFFAAYSLPQITGGENGLLDVPRLPLAGGQWFKTPYGFYTLCATLLAVLVVFIDLVKSSVVGTAYRAISENEHRAAAVGYNIYRLRLALFTFSGGMAGIAGCLYGFFLGLVPLSTIDITQSERIVIATVLGGTGGSPAALVGTIFLILAEDLLSRIWPHWQFALGAIIVLTVFFFRQGFWGVIEKAVVRLGSIRSRKRASTP